MAEQIPFVDYLVLGDDPHLVANECTACGARFFDRRNACASCSGTEFYYNQRFVIIVVFLMPLRKPPVLLTRPISYPVPVTEHQNIWAGNPATVCALW